MIRIVLLGRTGNNLFQYALGRALSEKHEIPLLLDASWYNHEGWKEVSHFLKLPLKAKVIRRFSLGTRILRNITGKHYWEYKGVSILRENDHDQSFNNRFLEAPSDCMLFGYFQSPLYFRDIENTLRKELLCLLNEGSDVHKVDEVTHNDSVAVHIRRGDYLQHPSLQVCGPAYYRSAISHMRKRIKGARFLIFSDDHTWCRNEFTDSDQRVIDSGDLRSNPLHDLHLMSKASHHIISNSTYSWWAAWLAKRNGQQVLMPDRWFVNTITAPIKEKRLPHWIIIPT